MKEITGKSFDEERAFYGCDGIRLTSCAIDGPLDGESAFKEGKRIWVKDSLLNLRYPFWHDKGVKIEGCDMTENCRAAQRRRCSRARAGSKCMSKSMSCNWSRKP